MGREYPQTGANRPESALTPLAPGPTPMAKTGAKSTAELATRVAYSRPLERLAPPADLSEDGRKLFLDLVLANEPTHFRASDLPLVSAYVRAVLQERTASRGGRPCDRRQAVAVAGGPWAVPEGAGRALAPAPLIAAG